MNQLNNLIIEGNLVSGELKENTFYFGIGVNRFTGNTELETSFFDVECYGNLAKLLEQKFKKGRGIRIVGRLKQDRWSDENGFHSRIKIIAEHIELKLS